MRATSSLLAKGFWGRSYDELKRLGKIAVTGSAIRRQLKPYVLYSFHEPTSPQDCKMICDYQQGGFSTAHLDWIPPSTSPSENKNGHVKFHGSISIELPPSRPDIQRSGYAAWRTKDRGYSAFGKLLWDVDAYAYLALRIKSDGRKYFVNLQSETIVPTDIHQHRLYARKPGEWETVRIAWNDFVRTNHGVVVEPANELLKQKIRSVGIGLIDRVPGPFELCIERIWATNEMQEDAIKEDGREEEGQLRNKHGEKLKWGKEKGKEELK